MFLVIWPGCDTSANNVPQQRFKYLFPVDKNLTDELIFKLNVQLLKLKPVRQ